MPKERLYYLDWLRIGAFGLLIIFHCTRFFDFFPWHVKNEDQSELVTQFFLFSTAWRMPLIFFVSGAGTYFAIRSRGNRFFTDRLKRLIVPFLFGIIILIPPQKYLEYLFYNNVDLSYLDFLKIYPQQIAEYRNGFNFTWFGQLGYHIWYLPYLFVQTILLLPYFNRVLNKENKAPKHFKNRTLYLLFVPLVLVNIILRPYFPQYLHWADFFHFLFFFWLGFYFVHHRNELKEMVLSSIRPMAFIAITTSLLTTYIALFTPYMIKWVDAPGPYWDYIASVVLRSVNALAWVILLLAWSIKYLSKSHSILPPLNEAVLPIYMLHQTFILIIGFYIVTWSIGIFLKFLIILILAGIAMYLTYFPIKKINLLRFLFGMKKK